MLLIKLQLEIQKLDSIYCHTAHAYCYEAMTERRDAVYPEDDSKRVLMLQNTEQGFMTNLKRFVDRNEGYEIAKRNDQIRKKHGNEGFFVFGRFVLVTKMRNYEEEYLVFNVFGNCLSMDDGCV